LDGVDADTKLVSCWHVDTPDAELAKCFIDDLASRLSNRIQLTIDGHKAYLEAVEDAFGANVDFIGKEKTIAAVIAPHNIRVLK
jgi:hypothetical protein